MARHQAERAQVGGATAGILVTAITGMIGANAILAGALGGAAQGAVSAEMQNQNVLKHAAVSATAGAIAGAIPVPGVQASRWGHILARAGQGAAYGASYGAGYALINNDNVLNRAVEGAARASISSAITASAHVVYDIAVGFEITWRPGFLGPGVTDKPQEHFNVVGFNSPPSGRLIEDIAIHGSPLSHFLNRIPSINATAGLHDNMMNTIDNAFPETFIGESFVTPINWASMIPCWSVTVAGALDGYGHYVYRPK